MTDVEVLGESEQKPGLVLGKPKEFWASRSTAILLGVILGVPGGVIGTALFLWAAGPDHWSRDSWLIVGAGFTAVWTGYSILLSLFGWWINHGIKRTF